MRVFTLLLLLASTNVAASNHVISTPGKAIIGVNATEVGKRVCFYQDMAYSEGAILQVGDHYLTCQSANDFETNGQLKWFQLDSEQNATQQEPKTNKKISQLPN